MGVIQKMASKHCKNRNKSDMNHEDIIDDYEVDKIIPMKEAAKQFLLLSTKLQKTNIAINQIQ